ncbi:MAG TPA: hypothetical protein VFY23_01645 [Candidatus Limnocylindrales bacterium]|nr:hypothetical protein [Candidatus Limnocylindrales bacterium]
MSRTRGSRPGAGRAVMALAMAAALVAAGGCGGAAPPATPTPAIPGASEPANASATTPPPGTPSSGTASASPDDTQPRAGTLAGDGWIAWQEGRSLTVARLDGSERRPLFADGADAGHPDWSPDGTRIAYVRDEADGTADIRTVNRDGTDDRLLVDCVTPCTFAEDPAWSPDGTRIAYWSNDAERQFIRVADAITGEVLHTVEAPELVGPVGPRWSPDGQRLAVHAEVYRPAGSDFVLEDGRIGVIDLAAAEPALELLTEPGLLASYPDWSPDGDRILFLAGNLQPFARGTPTDLWTIRPDGSEATLLRDGVAGEPRLATPAWTGAQPPILVTLIDGGSYVLGAVAPEGGPALRLVDASGRPMAGAHPRAWVR